MSPDQLPEEISDPSSLGTLDHRRRQLDDQNQPVLSLLKNPVWLFFGLAIAGHIAFWRLLPNPTKQHSQVLKLDKISTIPVVNLPASLLTKQSRFKLPQLNSSQIKTPNSIPSLYTIPQPGTLPPPPLLSLPPQDLPKNSAFKTPSNLSSSLALPAPTSRVPTQSNLNFPTAGSNLKIDPNNNSTPVNPQSANNSNSNLIDNSTNTKRPEPNQPPVDPVSGYSLNAADLIAPNSSNKNINKGGTNFSRFNRIMEQYGVSNVIQRQIASAEISIPPDKREPDVEWIPLDNKALNGSKGNVTFVLIVNPDGKVEQEPVIIESSNSALEEIAKQTVKGYYNKFKPLVQSEQGKYRFVRIQYKVP